MSPFARQMGGLAACLVGAWCMASALFGHAWLVGVHDGLEVGGGVIDVHYCSPADDPDPLPMGIGDLEGCASEMYHMSELGRSAGSWFGATTHGLLFSGAAATCFFLLFGLITGFGLEVGVAPYGTPLSFQLFDIEDGTFWAHAHPGRTAAGFVVLSWVNLTIALASAPEILAVGADVTKYLLGSGLALGGGLAIDPRVLMPVDAVVAMAGDGEETAEPQEAQTAKAEPLPEAEIEEDDSPRCVRCGKGTTWLEKVSRHRCGACGLYQPTHKPGELADR